MEALTRPRENARAEVLSRIAELQRKIADRRARAAARERVKRSLRSRAAS